MLHVLKQNFVNSQNRWRSEVAKDPVLQPIAVSEKLHATTLMQPQTPTTNFSVLQSNQQHHPGLNPQLIPSSSFPTQQTEIRTNPFSNQLQQQPTISSLQQNILAAGLPLLQPEAAALNFGQMHHHNVNPAPVSIILNHSTKDRISVPLQTPLNSQISWQWNEVGSNSGGGGSIVGVRQMMGFEGSVSNVNNVYAARVGGNVMPSSWERNNEYVSEQYIGNWSPDKSPGYGTEWDVPGQRDNSGGGGRNPRNSDWSKRRDFGRGDSSRNGGNRKKWRR